jgi:hypothetical protein
MLKLNSDNTRVGGYSKRMPSLGLMNVVTDLWVLKTQAIS